ncbi:ABC transporter ATP-binding protein [Sulfurisoma sediminicola]|nr:ABC transporter ATP-binding protein [Sulfurisoma sediminicola]
MPHAVHGTGTGGRIMAHLKEFLPFLSHQEDDYFWALRDVSFEVKPGEVMGILGRNGSGKSTLLKILSGVTAPTTGKAMLRGRVGSLLEVGTGFHPDLTGRENVFMSGVLLGIGKREIAAKLDEIIDFSGIEPFIDVPVKRYSSGMYVRLAYAVASMLHADVLILDEVMAVGDAAFREKSQRNIERLAGEGRTVLFVSHNARAVRNLCHTGIILDKGQCTFQGSAADAVITYLQKIHHYQPSQEELTATRWNLDDAPRLHDGGERVLTSVSLHAADGTPAREFHTGEPMRVRIGFHRCTLRQPYFAVLIHNEYAERVATINSSHFAPDLDAHGNGVAECLIEDLRLGEGSYYMMLDFGQYGGGRGLMTSADCVPNAATFDVSLGGYLGGIGLDAFQGAAHRARWSVVTSTSAAG